MGSVISHPIGPRWQTTSWKDAAWADNTWGTAVVVTVPDVRIGAGSSNGIGGLMLYAAMRMAEAQRRQDEKVIESLVAPIEEPVAIAIPPVVKRVTKLIRRVTKIGAIELHDPADDKKQELKVALDAPKPAPAKKPALVYPKTGYAEVPLEVIAPPPPSRAMGAVALEYATQLAEQQREALEEEELAMVFLLAA